MESRSGAGGRAPRHSRVADQPYQTTTTTPLITLAPPSDSQSSKTSLKMVLRLRLSRVSTPGGAKRHHPRYNIVLAQARTARDSQPLEVLGTYNPIPELPVGAEPGERKQKDIKVDVRRCQYWLGVGAQPSDTVWRLLSMVSAGPQMRTTACGSFRRQCSSRGYECRRADRKKWA